MPLFRADQETATSANGEEHKELEETGEEAEEYSERDIEAMKQRVKDMEAEAQKLREMQAEVEREQSALSGGLTEEEKEAVDARSVHVGNVDWGATPEEIQAHFQSCGTINRVTILCDKFTGHPKGFAYVEFAQPTAVADALVLNESLFRGRQIRVTPKRTNVPGMARGRGRGGRGYRGGAPSYRGYSPYGGRPRGRGRGGYRGGY